jgi:hypothetical protein
MASFNSILSNIGKGLKTFFTGAAKIAQVAEPLVDLALPGIAALYNTTVNAVVNAETAAIAAGEQSGTGAQKLQTVIAAIEPVFTQYAEQTGIPTAQRAAAIEAWVNAAVAGLNAIPSGTQP